MLRRLAAVLGAVLIAAAGVLPATSAAAAEWSTTRYGQTFIYHGDGAWTIVNTDGSKALKDIDSTQAVLCSDYDTGLGRPCADGASYDFVSTAFNDGLNCAYIQGDGGAHGSWDTVPGDPTKSVCAPEPPKTPEPPQEKPVSGAVVFADSACVDDAVVGNRMRVELGEGTTATYAIDGASPVALSAGEYGDDFLAPGLWSIVLTGEDGSTAEYSHTFVVPVETCGELPTLPSVPTAASAVDESCDADGLLPGAITVDLADGVTYFIDGAPVSSATTDLPAGVYHVTAVADPGIGLDGPSSWRLTVAGLDEGLCDDLDTLPLTGASAEGMAGLAAIAAIVGGGLLLLHLQRRPATARGRHRMS